MPKPEIIPIGAMTRGLLLALPAVPVAGYEWVEEITPWPPGDPLPGPWLVERSTAAGEPRLGRYRTILNPGRTEALAHQRFARLRTADQMCAFANKYGLLGQAQEVIGEDQWEPGPPVVRRSRPRLRPAEPLSTWVAEIRRMAILQALWSLVRTEDRRTLRRYIRWRDQGPCAVGIRFDWVLDRPPGLVAGHPAQRPPTQGGFYYCDESFSLDVISGAYVPTDQLGVYRNARGQRVLLYRAEVARQDEWGENALLNSWPEGDVLGPAYGHIAQIVNKRLQGQINPTVLADRRGLYFQPDSLLATLYALFALELTGRDRARVLCARPGCGNHFIPERQTRQFCSAACRKNASYHRRRGKVPRPARASDGLDRDDW